MIFIRNDNSKGVYNGLPVCAMRERVNRYTVK